MAQGRQTVNPVVNTT